MADQVAEPTRTEVLKEVLSQQAKAAEEVKAQEVPDPFKGEEPSFKEFSDWRDTGELPERFKEPPAAAEKPAEIEPVKESGETEQEKQERDDKGKFSKKVEFTPEQQEAFDRAFRKREAKLRREFEQQYAAKTSVVQPTAGEKPETAAPTRPEPPKLSTYKGTIEEFEKELAEYPAKLQAFHDATSQQQQKRQSIEKKLSSSESKTVKAHPDYKDEFQSLADDIKNNDEPALPPHVLQAIAEESEDPHGLTYYLAKNREEHRRLAELSPAAALREVLKLDLKIAAEPAPAKVEPKVKPKPPEPVGGRQVTSAFDVSDESMDSDEWARKRNKQLADRRAAR